MADIDTVITSGLELLKSEEFRAVVDRRMSLRASSICASIKKYVANLEQQHQVDKSAFKEWVASIKDLCHDLLDSWEELKLKESRKNGWRLVFPLCFRSSLLHQHKMGGSIRFFEEIDRAATRFISLFGISDSHIDIDMVPSYVLDGSHIYGREFETQNLLRKLLDKDGHQEEEKELVELISIVGKGGMGKTTLAQRVYNHPYVSYHFDHKAWVNAAEEFTLKHILVSVIRSLMSSVYLAHDVEVEALELRFLTIVEGRRFLLVLDDVWNENSDIWVDLKKLLIRCAPRSRILITTGMRRVAHMAQSYIIHLDVLSEKESWSVFRKFAFVDVTDESDIEPHFFEIGREILKRCRGLPLALKTIGVLLKGRPIAAWEDILKSDIWESDENFLSPILILNYSTMEPVLRQCLLYCSIFPKNYSIDVAKLIRLWMAQGFFGSDQDEMETKGRACFKQLLDRHFFEELKQDGDGYFKSKLYDGMRDFVQYLAEYESRIVFVDYEKEDRANHVPTRPRHCTLKIADQNPLPENIDNAEKLHTLMILSKYSAIDPTNLTKLLRRMRRLRALDLSSCSISVLPSQVGDLLHLRYLDLSFSHDLKKLPKAICNLFYLQTLNLNGCDSLRKLPKGIGKLVKLRHLEILWTTSLSYLPKGIASLTMLRTLSRFFGSSCAGSKACNLGDLENINSIQGSITIDGLNDETEISDAEKASLKNKKDLIGLELWFSIVGSKTKDLHLLDYLEAPPQLQCLGIFYYGGRLFPYWMITLQKLTHLMLADCSECIVLPPLGKLPLLESLEIKNMHELTRLDSEFLGIVSYDSDGIGEEGSSSTIAFPKLQILRFEALNEWEEWAEFDCADRDANVMPYLSSLSIMNCPKLIAIPDFTNRKKNFKTVFEECPLLEEHA